HPAPEHERPALTMGGIGPPLKPVARLKPGIARLGPRLHASKERLESPIDSLERVLGGLRWQWCVFCLAQLGQVAALLRIPQTDTLARPGRSPLLQGCVVQQPMRFPVGLQGGFLSWREIEAIGGPTV